MLLDRLPAVNASLNATAALLLVLGLTLIRRRNETGHKRAMLAAFGCSVLFLVSYIYYHAQAGSVAFSGEGLGRTLYLGLLLSHTALATAVPFLSVRTIFLALRDRRQAHRKWARITFPVWLYVSVTGVLIYLVLYHWTESAALARASG